jgi:hypothetical protein
LDLSFDSDSSNPARIAAASRLFGGEKDNIQSVDLSLDPSTRDIDALKFFELLKCVVRKQTNLRGFSLRYPYKAVPSQEAFFKAISSFPSVSNLRSFRCNSNDVASHIVPLLEKTPHLEELIIDDRYSDMISLLPHLPTLAPNLNIFVFFCSAGPNRSELSWEGLLPLTKLQKLSVLVISDAYLKLGLDSALKVLTPTFIVNCCFMSTIYASRYTASGSSFLHEAISARNYAQVEDLIQKGAQVGRETDSNVMYWREKPLDVAIRINNIDLCRLLLSAGASLSIGVPSKSSSLFWAISMAERTTIEFILNHAISEVLSATVTPFIRLHDGESIFHAAARNRDVSVLSLCLAHCATTIVDVNGLDGTGLPALAYVVSPDHAGLLVKFGADPNVVPAGQDGPLIEFMLTKSRFREAAFSLISSPACCPKIRLAPTQVERLLDARGGGGHSVPTWISTEKVKILRCLFDLYPPDELEQMLKRTEFWSRLPPTAPVAGSFPKLYWF